jgi:hypothetical protein
VDCGVAVSNDEPNIGGLQVRDAARRGEPAHRVPTAQTAAALRRFAEALAYAVATGNRRIQIYCVTGIACALLLRGDARAAARLRRSAEDQERRLGFRMLLNERQRYENLIQGARERLGTTYDVERRAGAGLTLEQAVAEARRHLPRS